MKAGLQLKRLHLLKNGLLGVLFALAILLVLFSLFSGSETHGGSISGIFRNSPNSLPWILFLIIVLIARRKTITGGLLITIFGCVITYFFNFTGGNFFLSTFIVCLSVIFLGIILIFTGLAIQNVSKNGSSENS